MSFWPQNGLFYPRLGTKSGTTFSWNPNSFSYHHKWKGVILNVELKIKSLAGKFNFFQLLSNAFLFGAAILLSVYLIMVAFHSNKDILDISLVQQVLIHSSIPSTIIVLAFSKLVLAFPKYWTLKFH